MYEDLVLKDLNISENGWLGLFASEAGGTFMFRVADSDISLKELIENDVVLGKSFLGVVRNNTLVAVNGLPIKKENGKIESSGYNLK